MRLGATKDLKLDVEWVFDFVGVGSKLLAEPQTLGLDVGGTLEAGIIDQHGRFEATSTAQLVLDHAGFVYPHLMGPFLDMALAGADLQGKRARFRVVLHQSPDFDCLVASWLAIKLVEGGAFPRWASALAEYTTLVDQGRYRFEAGLERSALEAVHVAYLMLQNLGGGDDHDRKALRAMCSLNDTPVDGAAALRIGHRFLDAIGAKLQHEKQTPSNGGELDPQTLAKIARKGADARSEALEAACRAWRDVPGVTEFLVPRLEADIDLQRQDEGSAGVIEVTVPLQGGGTTKVQAFLATEGTRSRLNKYWVRQRCPLFMAVYAHPSNKDRTRFVISVDPNFEDPTTKRKLSLRGLGAALEAEEGRVRSATETGDTRSGVPRWPGVSHNDPWYDGRSHHWTIVDTPRDGSVLSVEQVKSVLTRPYWDVPGAEVRHSYDLLLVKTLGGGKEPAEKPGSVSSQHAAIKDEALKMLRGQPVAALDSEIALPASRRFECHASPERKERLTNGATPGERLDAYAELVVYDLSNDARGQEKAEEILAHLRESATGSPSRELQLGGAVLLATGSKLVIVGLDPIAHVGADRGKGESLHDVRIVATFLWLCVHWQVERLGDFSVELGAIVPEDDTRKAGDIDIARALRLMNDFLRFEALYWQVDVVKSAWAKELHRFYVEHHMLRDQFDEIRAEVSRVEAISHSTMQGRQNVLLSVVGALQGLGAVAAGTSAAWPEIASRVKAHPTLAGVGGVGAMVLLGVLGRRLIEWVKPGTFEPIGASEAHVYVPHESDVHVDRHVN